MVSFYDPSETAQLEETVKGEFKAISQKLNNWLDRIGYDQKQEVAIDEQYSVVVQYTTDDCGCITFAEMLDGNHQYYCIDSIKSDVLIMATNVIGTAIEKINEDLCEKEIAASSAIKVLKGISESLSKAMDASTSIVEIVEPESSTDSEAPASEETESDSSPDPEYLLFIAEADVAAAGLEDSIRSLKITAGACSSLARAGITKISELLIRPENEIWSIRNFGLKSLKRLKAELKAHGLSLRK